MSHGHTARKLRHLIQITAPGLLALFEYRPSWLPKDVATGLSVAAIALPVGIAYADLAGVPTVIGMYSAIFPLFAYRLARETHSDRRDQIVWYEPVTEEVGRTYSVDPHTSLWKRFLVGFVGPASGGVAASSTGQPSI